MMKTRMIAGFAALAATGALVTVVPATADAAPRAGASCHRAQLGDLRMTGGDRGVVCLNTRAGTKWTRTAGVDPRVRKPGQPCGRGYNVAKSPRGKALMCDGRTWRANQYG